MDIKSPLEIGGEIVRGATGLVRVVASLPETLVGIREDNQKNFDRAIEEVHSLREEVSGLNSVFEQVASTRRGRVLLRAAGAELPVPANGNGLPAELGESNGHSAE